MPQERTSEEDPLSYTGMYDHYSLSSSPARYPNVRSKHAKPRPVTSRIANHRARTRYHVLQDLSHERKQAQRVRNTVHLTDAPKVESKSASPLILECEDEAGAQWRSVSSTHSDEHAPTDGNKRYRARVFRPFRAARAGCRNWLRRSRLHGWRMGVLLGSCATAFVLGWNIAAIAKAYQTESGFDKDGIAVLITGGRYSMFMWNIFLHLVINAFSTVLLAASNYTMQVLNAPTRGEIERTHQSGSWFEIGLLSLRNLRYIPRKRAMLCIALAMSSVPLHLLYNAAVFRVDTNNEFQITLMGQNYTAIDALRNTSTRLSMDEVKAVYSSKYSIFDYGDLVLVADQIRFPLNWTQIGSVKSDNLPLVVNSTFWRFAQWTDGWSQLSWSTVNRRNYSTPEPLLDITFRVLEGFAVEQPRKTAIQISLHFMLIVTACNLVKLFIMIYVLVTDVSEPIVTLGDAISTFMESPESLTEGISIQSRKRILWAVQTLKPKPNITLTPDEFDIGTTWRPVRERYWASVGAERIAGAILTGSLLVAVVATYRSRGPEAEDIRRWRWGAASLGELNLGNTGDTTGNLNIGMLRCALLANLPHVFLSLFYIQLNAMCTAMAGMLEWNGLAVRRKGLRVTRPQGEQRSTYFLQLPYRFAVPGILVSMFLHWVLSQTFALTLSRTNGKAGEPVLSDARIGISDLSLTVFGGSCLLMVWTIWLVGRRSIWPDIVMARNCSLMISAACHPGPDEIDPHLGKVKWGVVPGLGRCSFTRKTALRPDVGETYH